MAPIKFEDDIREKLQNREIAPSAGAWTQLDNALEETRPSKRNYRYWWAVAAAIVLMAVSFPLLFQSESVPVQVASEEVKTEEILSGETTNETQISEKELKIVEPEETVAEVPLENIITPPDPEPVVRSDSEQNTDLALVSDPVQKEDTVTIETPQELTKEAVPSYEDAKVSEVVAQVQQMDRSGEVSPEEVEALLLQAQRDIANRKILDADVVQVDAKSLLMDVETEIERSFRDKVFEALGEGFEKVRTAVVERNN